MKKNLTNDDYVIKHTYNNTRLRKKKVSLFLLVNHIKFKTNIKQALKENIYS